MPVYEAVLSILTYADRADQIVAQLEEELESRKNRAAAYKRERQRLESEKESLLESLAQHYASADTLVINTVLAENPERRIYHLCPAEAEEIVAAIRPRRTILTHFGMRLLRAKPWEIAESMSQRLGLEIVAARDGMTMAIGAQD